MTFKADLLSDITVSSPKGEAIPINEGSEFYVIGRSVVKGEVYYNLVQELTSKDVFRIPERLLSVYQEGTLLPIQIFSVRELTYGVVIPEESEPPAKR